VKHKAGILSAALEAGLGEISRQLLAMHLGRLEAVEEDILKVENLIAAHLAPNRDKLELLMTIPGVSYLSACVILSELGVNMAQWPTEKHLAAWGGVAPGCRESAGKHRRAATRKGNPYLCTTMVECAGAATLKKDCHLQAKYRHLCARTGSKMKARMAIARKLLVIVYHVLTNLEPYREPEVRAHTPRSRQKTIQRHLKELEKLGLEVQLTEIQNNI